MRQLIFHEERNRYELICEFGEHYPAKRAGFKWDHDGVKRWWTTDTDKALKLEKYADAELRPEFDRLLAEKAEKREASRAFDADIEIPAPEGLAYMPFQRAGIAYALSRPNTLIADEMGLGKAQPIDTPILTPTGWVKMGDIQIDDEVIGSDGEPTKVIGVYPQGERNCFKVTFSDKTSTECDLDHLWEVTTANWKFRGAPPKVLPTSELLRLGLKDKAGNRKWEIPLVKNPVAFKHQDLPISPWLLGVLIGDGGFSQVSVYLSNPEPEIINRVENEIKPLGLHLKDTEPKKDEKLNYRLTHGEVNKPNPIKEILKDLGLMGKMSYQKHIPHQYLFSRPEQRSELLRGLMDTDGWVNHNRRKRGNAAQISTSSPQLADDIVFLVQSLGGIARRRLKATPRRDAHVITISLPRGMQPFWLPRKRNAYPNMREKYAPTRKIESIEFSRRVEAQCIKVKNGNGLYLTNDCIVTHNTIQALGVINAIAAAEVQRVLVICPASLRLNWLQESEKWLVHDHLHPKVIGPKNPITGNESFMIINYDILNKHKDALRSVDWDVMICDEAHYLKSPRAQRTKSVLGFSDKKKGVDIPPVPAKRKLFLTGTPIVNRPKELHPLVSALAPTEFGNFWEYATRYCNAQQTRYGWDFDGATHLDELQDRLRETCMVRRLKTEVLTELPAKRRSVIELPANGNTRVIAAEQKAAAFHADTLSELKAAVELAKVSDDPEVYEKAVARLKEAATVHFTEISALRKATAIAKAPLVAQHIRDSVENGSKIIVFAHHHEVIDTLTEELEDIGCVKLDGRDSMEARNDAVNVFQNDAGVKVFVGGIKAAGVGLTLTASSHVVFAELDYVPASISQAEDRAHRISQKNQVLVQHLVLEGSLDVRMAQILVEKQKTIDQALDKKSEAPAEMDEPIIPIATKPISPRKAALEKAAEKLTDADIAKIHADLKFLAACCDGAMAEDGAGFSKIDVHIGKSLAAAETLTRKQAALGQLLTRKYHRQLQG